MTVHRAMALCVLGLLPAGAGAHETVLSSTVLDLGALDQEGWKLNDAEGAALEEHLLRSPDDVAARIKVLSYYHHTSRAGWKPGSPRPGHVLWLIQHQPDLDYDRVSHLIYLTPWADEREIPVIKQAWDRSLREKPDDLRRMGNAAASLEYADIPYVKSLLVRAEQLEPGNPRWPRSLGRMAERRIIINSKTGQVDVAAAAEAFAAYERALSHVAPDEGWILRDLRIHLCKTAVDAGKLDAAKRYGTLLVDGARAPLMHAYEKAGAFEAKNAGHTALGRVALRRGDLKAARRHLLESAGGEGAPVLSSFGPNMRFAREMLEKGERKTVLEFFSRCRVFWKSGKDKLDDWTIYVKGGGIPDFGANLSY